MLTPGQAQPGIVPPQPAQPPARPLAGWRAARARSDRPLAAGLVALAGAAGFVLARLYLAAGGNITEFVRAALPYSRPGRVPPGLHVFGTNGYDGQFYYRLALDPADLHRSAFGITLDAPFRLQRIGYPALTWLAALGRHSWVPVALVAVNVAALGAAGLIGGMLARDSGRHAMWGLLLAGYFGFFIALGCDLTEPVAAVCLLGGILACRRGHPVAAGLVFGYGALTRETVLIMPAALGLARLAAMLRDRVPPVAAAAGSAPVRLGAADAAWVLPVLAFGGWQFVLRAVTGQFIAFSGVGDNSSPGLPFGQFADAVRMNAGLLWPATGAAYIWLLEVAVLLAVLLAAASTLRTTGVPGYERLAFAGFVVELGFLSAAIWSGHADLRSIDECYLLAVLVLLGSKRRLAPLALCAVAVAVVAGAHQALYL